MKVERIRPTVFRVTLHAYELSSLIAAARWVAGGAKGEIDPEAVSQLKQVLENYDAAASRPGPPVGPDSSTPPSR